MAANMPLEAAPSAAQGLLALLEEDEPALQEHALKQLFKIVDNHWAEVANKVPLIEAISEDTSFAVRLAHTSYLFSKI